MDHVFKNIKSKKIVFLWGLEKETPNINNKIFVIFKFRFFYFFISKFVLMPR